MNLIVVGQGYVGLPISILAAKSGYKVYGFDLDELKIKNLKLGKTNSPEVSKVDLLKLQAQNKLSFVSVIPKLSQPCIYVIAVPTPLSKNNMPDISFLREACLSISKVVTEHSLIINESTSFIGTLTELIKPIIESNSRLSNLDFAVAPERIDPGNRNWSLEITPRIVAGINERSTQRVFEFYSTFCKNVYKVSKPEVAEAAKLLENTFRQVNIALINEVAEIAGAYNFSVYEAISAAATKPYGFTPFYPGVGVGGHCIPVDPGYLEYSADKVKVDTKLIPTANRINKLVPKKLSERIRIYMNGSLKSLKIQIVGISYKPNVADIRESPALELLSELQALEATVFWHDPLVKEWNGSHSSSLEPDVDLGVIISPHDEIDFSTWVKSGTNVIDISTSNKSYGWPKFL